MSACLPLASPPAPDAAVTDAAVTGGDAGVRALIERQLAQLGRLAEAGLNIALAIERQALAGEAAAPEASGTAPAAPEVVRGDIALAYGRVSRAVRLTIALQGRLIENLQTLDEAAARRRLKAQADIGRERQAEAAARKGRVERIIERLVFAEAKDQADGESLADEALERLEHDDIYGDLSARPVSETIALIARDLGLKPDWPGLSQEAWAQEELASEAVGAPLTVFRWCDDPSPRPPPDAPPPGSSRPSG